MTISPTAQRTLLIIGFGLMAALLLWRAGTMLSDAYVAVTYPFELDYGEGIVWQQAIMMIEGRAYGDINQYPFIVFHYPPVYHMLALAVASLTGLDQLTAGRTLELVATIIAALIVGGIARHLTLLRTQDRGHSLICGAAATLVTVSFIPVHAWAPLMRVDMVALAFSLAGFLLALKSISRPPLIHFASLCFVFAVYTRQTMLAAPIACFLVLLLWRHETALRGIGSGLILGLTPLAILSILTDGGFLTHILSYNVNRYSFERLGQLTDLFQSYSLYIFISFYVVFAMQRMIRADQQWSVENEVESPDILGVQFAMTISYVVLASLSLLLFGKSGSSLNYMVEWCCTLAILIGMAIPPFHQGFQATHFGRLGILVPFLIAVQNLIGPWIDFKGKIGQPPSFAERYRLLEEVRRSSKPILSDDMVMLMKAGKQVPYESAIFAELSSQGRWDSRLIVHMIEQRRFGMVFTHGKRGEAFYTARYPIAVSDAIDRAYPRKINFGRFVIHAPVEH